MVFLLFLALELGFPVSLCPVPYYTRYLVLRLHLCGSEDTLPFGCFHCLQRKGGQKQEEHQQKRCKTDGCQSFVFHNVPPINFIWKILSQPYFTIFKSMCQALRKIFTIPHFAQKQDAKFVQYNERRAKKEQPQLREAAPLWFILPIIFFAVFCVNPHESARAPMPKCLKNAWRWMKKSRGYKEKAGGDLFACR